MQLRVRECAVCREERIASSAKSFSATRAAPVPPVLRVAPLPPFQAPPRQAQAHPQPAPHAAPYPPPPTAHPPLAQSYAQTLHPLYKKIARRNARRNARTSESLPVLVRPQAPQAHAAPPPSLLPTTHPQPPLRANQQARAPAATRRRAPASPESREASPFPPFGSPAVLPPHPLFKKKVRRNTRRGTHAPVPQPPVQVAKSTQPPQVQSLLNLRVIIPPSPTANARPPRLMSVRVSTPPPQSVTTAPTACTGACDCSTALNSASEEITRCCAHSERECQLSMQRVRVWWLQRICRVYDNATRFR